MARFPFEAATRDALLHLLDTAPRFGSTDSARAVAATACSAAAELFEAESAVLLHVLDERHAVVEARVPSTVLMPPGRAFPAKRPARSRRALPPVGDGRDRPTLLATGNTVRVPLSGDDQFGYVLVLQWEQEVRLEPELMLALQRFGDRAGLALERAERRGAEADARHNSAQTQRLLALSASLAAARTVDEVAGALLAEGRQQLEAGTVRVYMLEKGRLQPLVHDVAAAPAPQRPDDTGGPTTEALERNVIVLVESPAARAERYPELDATAAFRGVGDGAALRRIRGGRDRRAAVRGVARLRRRRPRVPTPQPSAARAVSRSSAPACKPRSTRSRRGSSASSCPYACRWCQASCTRSSTTRGAELMDVGGDWYDTSNWGTAGWALRSVTSSARASRRPG